MERRLNGTLEDTFVVPKVCFATTMMPFDINGVDRIFDRAGKDEHYYQRDCARILRVTVKLDGIPNKRGIKIIL